MSVDPVEIQRTLTEGEGYARLPALITPDQAADLRGRALARLDQGQPAGEGQVRLPDPLTWDADFLALVTHPTLLAVAHQLLGPDATLGAYSARVLMPGCELGALHVDYPYWAMEPGMPVSPPLMLQVIWMMEPFTATNGGTLVAPGSQKWGGVPELERFGDHAIHATGNAGDALVSHGLLWHRTAINHADEPRLAILINYTQLTVRPMVPLPAVPEALEAAVSPQLATLLGRDFGRSLGRRVPRLR